LEFIHEIDNKKDMHRFLMQLLKVLDKGRMNK